MKVLPARVARLEGDEVALCAPGVGYFIPGLAVGDEVMAGQRMGVLVVLGVRHPVEVPEGVEGVVGERVTQSAVDYATRLAVVSARNAQAAAGPARVRSDAARGTLAFVAPMSGRFYRRPAPDQPCFVDEGDEIQTGTVIGLLEVMKTFNRLEYGGAGLPDPARILRVVPEDGADLNGGDPILELESIG